MNDEKNISSEAELDDILDSIVAGNSGGSLLPKRSKPFESLNNAAGKVTAAQAKPAVKAEAKPAVKAEAKPAVKAEAKPAAKAEAKAEAKPATEAKPAAKAEAKPATEAKPAVKAEAKTQAVPVSKAEKPAEQPASQPRSEGFSHPFVNGGELQPSVEESIRESEKNGMKLVSSDGAAASVSAALESSRRSAEAKKAADGNNGANKDEPSVKEAERTERDGEKDSRDELLDTGDDLMVLDESEYKVRFRDTAFMGVLKMVIYIVAVVVTSLVISYGIIMAGNDIFAFSKGEPCEKHITLPDEANVTEIAKLLESEGIIESPITFEYYARFKEFKEKKSEQEESEGVQTVEASESTFVTLVNKVLSYGLGFLDYLKNEKSFSYIPGEYLLDNSMSYDKIINEITQVKKVREIIKITIPEGYTTDEIIDLFHENGIEASREDFLHAINEYDYDYEFVHALEEQGMHDARTYRLDGYLFPDTYEFYNDESAISIIDKLLTNFDNKFDTSYFDRAASLDMSVDDIINLAALIEKEAKLPAEQLIISSVFHNRITSGDPPRLESCATVQYVYQIMYSERKARILDSDTAIEHPYNTYKNRGLPPGPIANPGLNAIIAALYPEDTNFKYFVAKADGSSLFAETYNQHLANKEKAEKGFED